MSERTTASLESGRRVYARGHEIVVHTQRIHDSRHVCFVFLADPYEASRELKIFRGIGATGGEAEQVTLREALAYLDRPTVGNPASIVVGRNTLDIAGRKVDIFCDLVGEELYQAFPFLYRPDGTRVIIIQFHLKEAVTGATPAEAINACIERLEEYFLKTAPSD